MTGNQPEPNRLGPWFWLRRLADGSVCRLCRRRRLAWHIWEMCPWCDLNETCPPRGRI